MNLVNQFSRPKWLFCKNIKANDRQTTKQPDYWKLLKNMPAQANYLASILDTFAAFLELQEAASGDRDAATLLFIHFLEKKQNYDRWTEAELAAFLEKNPEARQFAQIPKQLVRQFVSDYPPYQTNVLLYQYLLALRSEGCSDSTIKNYRSDINQFLQFSNETVINQAIAKPKVVEFLRYQRQKGLKQSSVRRKLVSISQFAVWLESRALLSRATEWLRQISTALESIDTWAVDEIAKTDEPNKTDKTDEVAVTPTPVRMKAAKGNLPLKSLAAPRAADGNTAIKPPPTKTKTTAQGQQEFRTRLKQQLSALSNRVESGTRNKLLPYLNIAMLVLFVLGAGFFGYQQFIRDADSPLAFPSALTPPNRTLSFQGRLTNANRNPIDDPINIRFVLYDDGPSISGGNILWNSGPCLIDPDQDGIFSVGLGDDCGGGITDDVFTEHSNVWLQIEIDNGDEYEVLEPRQSIKTVPYAINAETLQGFPPAMSAVESTILVMDENGDINLGSLNPDLRATNGTFTIEAQALVLQTASGSDGDIVLAPDGTGEVAVLSDLFLAGYLWAPGATLSATYAGGTPLVINGVSGQSANLTEWNDGNGNVTVIDEDGRIGIGNSSPAAMLDVVGVSSNMSALFADNVTNNTTKLARIGLRHYINAEEPVGLIYAESNFSNTTNSIHIGGGVSQFNAANTISFYTAANSTTTTGTARMFINAAGDVGIGTTSPANPFHVFKNVSTFGGSAFGQSAAVQLSVGPGAHEPILRFQTNGTSRWELFTYGTTSGNAGKFGIADGTNHTSPALVIDTNKFVGIGTTGPSALLEVAGAFGTSTTGFKLYNNSAASTSNISEIGFNLNRTTGGQTQTAAIRGLITDINNELPHGELSFMTVGSYPFGSPGGPPSEKMRINWRGQVGIGTDSPVARLDVVSFAGGFMFDPEITALFSDSINNNVDKYTRIGLRHRQNAEEPVGLIFAGSETTGNYLHFGGGADQFNAATNINFYTAANTTTTIGTARMTIDSVGSVGINNLNPSEKLDIGAGNIEIDLEYGIGRQIGGATFTHGSKTIPQYGLIWSQLDYQTNPGAQLSGYGGVSIYTGGTPRITVTQAGLVGIGTTSPETPLHVNGNARVVFAAAAANTVCRDGNGTFTTCSSLAQYKDNKQNLSLGLETIMQLRPVEFDWNIDDKSHDLGLIAEEVAAVNPILAQYESDGSLSGVKYHHMVALLVKGIQQQQEQIVSLSSQLALLNPNTSAALQLNNFFIDSTGNLAIEKTANDNYQVRDTANNSLATAVGRMAELVVGRIRAGSIAVRELSVDTLTIAGLPLQDYIASTLLQMGGGPEGDGSGELISPVAHLDSLEVTGETLLADLLVTENATFSGTLTAETTLLGELTAETATIAGTLVAENIEAGDITAATISAHSTRLAMLESRVAEFERVKAETAEFMDATISGTLYADTIMVRNKIALAEEKPSIIEIIKEKVVQEEGGSESGGGNLQPVYDTVAGSGYEASSSADLDWQLSELQLATSDVVITGQALYLDNYLRVNGSAFIADSLGVGGQLLVGQGMRLADGSISYTAPAGAEQLLEIQPSGAGTLSLMAGLLTLTEDGHVTISGNLTVAGALEVQDTLLANLIQPADFGNPFQVQVAGADTSSGEVKESRFEIINELGTPVATISAEGRADFAAGIGVGSEKLSVSEDDSEVESNKTSGRAAVPAGAKEITIRSQLITENSLIYVTPVGSTQNQVLYVKSQQANNSDTSGKFVVGFDATTPEKVNFNWWIVN